MDRIGVRELRQHASKYLDRVKAGHIVEVTERGTLVALLVPPTASQGARDQLVSAGRLLPATKPFVFPRRIAADQRSEDVLDDLRDER